MELKEFYQYIDEDERLKSKYGSIEYLTTCHLIDRFLHPHDRILEIGAGYGAYSLKYAKDGYAVEALDLMEHHVAGILAEKDANMKINATVGDALDLSRYEDDSFDIVLCLGPLYHLHGLEEKVTCIKEAKRVCKSNGVMFFAYLSNDMCMITEQFANNPVHLLEGNYDPDNFHMKDDIFSFMEVDEARTLMDTCGIKRLCEAGVDGVAELLRDKINAFDDDYFNAWLRFHFHICEKPEMLGFSNHILYIGTKP